MRLLPNERDIVAKAREGDVAAFHDLYEAYRRPVFTFICRMTGSREDSEDLLQDVFVKAYRRLKSFRGDSDFSTWLFSIAKNETISFLRRHRRRNGKDVGLEEVHGAENAGCWTAEADDPEAEILSRETEAVFQRALASLPANYRAAFILGVVEGLPYEEVGRILSCTVPNIKSRIFRARARLARWIAQNYPEFGRQRTPAARDRTR